MSTRAEREKILQECTSNQWKGLRKDPCLTTFLDAMDQADAEGLNQMVESLISQIRRSGHGSGFILELLTASALFPVPAPRTLSCERMEGMCRVPGDLWLDYDGRRYEFQCKNSMNWTVEFWVAAATDRIVRETAGCMPGYYYSLRPTVLGTNADWNEFASWLLEDYRTVADGEWHDFYREGRKITEIRLIPSRKDGIRMLSVMSPGGVQVLETNLLRRKLADALRESRRSFSSVASENHFNCLVVDYANMLIDKDDLFQALYGDALVNTDTRLEPRLDNNGLFLDDQWRLYSAVVFVRLRDCRPLTVHPLVFPNPHWFEAILTSFERLPDFKIVESTEDVDL